MSDVETRVSHQVQMEASKFGRLFRNNRGLFFTMSGEKVKAGLQTDGASDLIGFTPITITQDMVGRKVAVFTAAEVKRPGWKGPKTETEKKQQSFIDFVKSFGGIAFFISNHTEYKKHLDEYKKV